MCSLPSSPRDKTLKVERGGIPVKRTLSGGRHSNQQQNNEVDDGTCQRGNHITYLCQARQVHWLCQRLGQTKKIKFLAVLHLPILSSFYLLSANSRRRTTHLSLSLFRGRKILLLPPSLVMLPLRFPPVYLYLLHLLVASQHLLTQQSQLFTSLVYKRHSAKLMCESFLIRRSRRQSTIGRGLQKCVC